MWAVFLHSRSEVVGAQGRQIVKDSGVLAGEGSDQFLVCHSGQPLFFIESDARDHLQWPLLRRHLNRTPIIHWLSNELARKRA